jgi:hypothetical protein
MLTCPHCESSLAEPASSQPNREDGPWDGLCAACGRSIYEAHDHSAAPDPEAFDSRTVGERALDLLEETVGEIQKRFFRVATKPKSTSAG